jgi:L-threonylcarbamoyladenylate synthase
LKTEVIKIDTDNIDLENIRYAAQVLTKGGLVSFPTETVYGLGANALNTAAVKNIFLAKGRPSDNPLIVHISSKQQINELVSELPAAASILMDTFWPGPLTIVLKKSDIVPHEVTGGLDTVAIRMPSHPVALALIRESGVPVVAPSSNTSGRPSPTEAKHVIEDLTGKIDIIIDAGSTTIGLESTVIDVTGAVPVVLRPGGVTLSQLEELLPQVEISPNLTEEQMKYTTPRAPGMKYKHYAPKAQMIIVEGELSRIVDKINELLSTYVSEGLNVGVLATDETKDQYSHGNVISMGSRHNPEIIAANLFRALRDFDEMNVQLILAEAVDNHGIGFAVMNRMTKAAGHNIIKA